MVSTPYPPDRDGRQVIRDRELMRALRQAFTFASERGSSLKCTEARHAGIPSGCSNDGTTCLCACHDTA